MQNRAVMFGDVTVREEHNPASILVGRVWRGNRSLLLRLSRCLRQGSRPTKALAGFFFWRLRNWTTWPASYPAHGTSGMMGFGVMRSPVGVVQRTAEGSQAGGLLIHPADAPMPWLREAEKLANSYRVGFASPSTYHQEA